MTADAPDDTAERRRGTERLITFCDCFVSIAATLLVLPLVDIAQELGDKPVGTLLRDNAASLWVFVLSFGVICRFWLVHHRIYQYVVDYGNTLIWANFLWLLSIVFLPFPTELVVGDNGHDRLTYVLYIGTMIVTTGCTSWQLWLISREPRLHTAAFRPPSRYTLWSTPVTLAIALIITMLVPTIGAFSLFLLFAGAFVENRTSGGRSLSRSGR